MVLPPPAADAGAGEDPPGVRRLLRLLHLGRDGTLLLARGGEGAAPALVRALVREWPDVSVTLDVGDLRGAPEGALMVARAGLDDAGWLNLARPVLAARRLRVVLLATDAVAAELRRGAPDLYDWISHEVELPDQPPTFARAGVRATLADGLAWEGPGEPPLDEPARTVAAGDYDALVAAMDAPEVVRVVGVERPAAARAVRWAMTEAGRTGRVVLDRPTALCPGWWAVSGGRMPWDAAAARLARLGGDAARVAALLDLEPAAVTLVARRGLPSALLQGPGGWGADPAALVARVWKAPPGTGLAARAKARRRRAPDAVEALLQRGPDGPEEWAELARRAEEAGALGPAARWHGRAAAAGRERVAQVQTLVAAGRVREARALAEAALARRAPRGGGAEAQADRVWLEMALAEILLGEGQLHEAGLRLARAAGHARRASARARAAVAGARGDLCRALGQSEQAERWYRAGVRGARAALREAREDGGDRTLARRDLSVAVARLGEMLVARGDTAGAIERFEEGLALDREALLAGDAPTEAPRDVAVSLARLGALYGARGDGERARAMTLEALAGVTELAARQPERRELRRDQSVLHNQLGDLALAEGRLEEALARFGEALTIRQALRDPALPDSERDLATSHHKLGDALRARGRVREAREHYEEARALRVPLAAGPEVRLGVLRELSADWTALGDLALATGERAEAGRCYAEALGIAETLAAREPTRADLVRELAVSLERMPGVTPAETHAGWLVRAVELRRRLRARDPDHPGLARELAVSLAQLGDTGDVAARAEAAEIFGALRAAGLLEARFHELADRIGSRVTGAG